MRSIILAAVLLAAGPAIAQNNQAPTPAPSSAPTMPDFNAGGGPRGGAMQVCRPDIETLCKGVQPGGGRILQCMKTNYTKLSPGCSSALKAMRAPG